MRVNKLITFSAGGPVNIETGKDGTAMANFGALRPVMVRALSIQVAAGSTHRGYVMDGIYGVQADGISPRVPDKTVGTDVTAELGASPSAEQPGGQYGDPYVLPNGAAGTDVTKTWVDGTAGETARVSYDTIEQLR